MPAYSFMKQFVPVVESGEKTHTIRAKRKARPQPGQRFVAYYAMRTKQCRKLLESVITKVEDITIENGPYASDEQHDPLITIDDLRLDMTEMRTLAKRDGFADIAQMMDFWVKTHELPFNGDIIHWKKVGKK